MVAQHILRESPLAEMTSLMVHNSGPFYGYAPGEAIHRVDARDSAPHVWAGLLTPVTDFPQLMATEMSGPYAAGTSPDGKQTVNRVWASHTIDLIHRPYFPRAVQITALDRLPLVTCRDNFSVVDNLLSDFNHMICPVPVGFEPWDLPPEARGVRVPNDVKEFMAQPNVGALGYRDKCLADAEKLCDETDIGRSLLAAIKQMRDAIAGYRNYATAYIVFEENQIEKQGKLQEGKATYDPYDQRLLWLLGRKEKTIQAPQVVVSGGPQTLTMDPNFGKSIGDAIAAAVAPLRDEIEAMKKRKARRPSLINHKKQNEAESV